MSAQQVPVKRNWPRYAVSPAGDRARFDCPGDIPPGWNLETPLPGVENPEILADLREAVAALPKRGPGRPRKDAA